MASSFAFHSFSKILFNGRPHGGLPKLQDFDDTSRSSRLRPMVFPIIAADQRFGLFVTDDLFG